MGTTPPAIPECTLFSAIVALRSKEMIPLRVEVIEIESSERAPASKQITKLGLSSKCLYVFR